MTNPLLESAKKFGPKKSRLRLVVTRDECEMMVEYLNGVISTAQYGHAINRKQSDIHHRVYSVMKTGIENGWVEIKSIKLL